MVTASPPGAAADIISAALCTVQVPLSVEKPCVLPLLKSALRSTSLGPLVLPGCGSSGAPVWSRHQLSFWLTRPISPNGSPLRAGSAPVSAARVRSAPAPRDRSYRDRKSVGEGKRVD